MVKREMLTLLEVSPRAFSRSPESAAVCLPSKPSPSRSSREQAGRPLGTAMVAA